MTAGSSAELHGCRFSLTKRAEGAAHHKALWDLCPCRVGNTLRGKPTRSQPSAHGGLQRAHRPRPLGRWEVPVTAWQSAAPGVAARAGGAAAGRCVVRGKRCCSPATLKHPERLAKTHILKSPPRAQGGQARAASRACWRLAWAASRGASPPPRRPPSRPQRSFPCAGWTAARLCCACHSMRGWSSCAQRARSRRACRQACSACASKVGGVVPSLGPCLASLQLLRPSRREQLPVLLGRA